MVRKLCDIDPEHKGRRRWLECRLTECNEGRGRHLCWSRRQTKTPGCPCEPGSAHSVLLGGRAQSSALSRMTCMHQCPSGEYSSSYSEISGWPWLHKGALPCTGVRQKSHVMVSKIQVSSRRFSEASRPPNSRSLPPGRSTIEAKSLGEGLTAFCSSSTGAHSHVSCPRSPLST